MKTNKSFYIEYDKPDIITTYVFCYDYQRDYLLQAIINDTDFIYSFEDDGITQDRYLDVELIHGERELFKGPGQARDWDKVNKDSIFIEAEYGMVDLGELAYLVDKFYSEKVLKNHV